MLWFFYPPSPSHSLCPQPLSVAQSLTSMKTLQYVVTFLPDKQQRSPCINFPLVLLERAEERKAREVGGVKGWKRHSTVEEVFSLKAKLTHSSSSRPDGGEDLPKQSEGAVEGRSVRVSPSLLSLQRQSSERSVSSLLSFSPSLSHSLPLSPHALSRSLLLPPSLWLSLTLRSNYALWFINPGRVTWPNTSNIQHIFSQATKCLEGRKRGTESLSFCF